MAWYIGINNGSDEYTVTQASSSTGKDIEIVIPTNANVPSVQELEIALTKLMNAVLRAGKSW